MSSHREAPEISKDPVADSTDLYAFVSPDRPDTVTLIANYIPLQAPAGGPNFFEFGDDKAQPLFCLLAERVKGFAGEFVHVLRQNEEDCLAMDAEFRRAFHYVRFRPETVGLFDGGLDADFGGGGALLGGIRAEGRAKRDDVAVQHLQRRRRNRRVGAVLGEAQ